MSKVIMVTSFKGGVGKTTVAANLAMSLARKGERIAVIDCDLESRCLDMTLGLENSSLYNLFDVLSGVCTVEDAIVTDPRCENLSFLAAPPTFSALSRRTGGAYLFSRGRIKAFIDTLSASFAYIILDLPARPDELYARLIHFADYALILSFHTAASIRAAEKTAAAIMEIAQSEAALLNPPPARDEPDGGQPPPPPARPETRLILNCFFAKDAQSGEKPSVHDVLTKARVQLIGVLPYDKKMADGQEKGLLAYELSEKTPFYKAIENISDRILGYRVPLLSGVKTGVKRKDLC